MIWSYCPEKINEHGKDRMRFELGDTQVNGGGETCALCDEEYTAIISEKINGENNIKKAWMFAKLAVLEAILFKLSYQVDTKIDVASWDFGKRAEFWKKLYEGVKVEIKDNLNVPFMSEKAKNKPPYFYTGMKENPRTKYKLSPFFKR